jgi:hypothetical protein
MNGEAIDKSIAQAVAAVEAIAIPDLGYPTRKLGARLEAQLVCSMEGDDCVSKSNTPR